MLHTCKQLHSRNLRIVGQCIQDLTNAAFGMHQPSFRRCGSQYLQDPLHNRICYMTAQPRRIAAAQLHAAEQAIWQLLCMPWRRQKSTELIVSRSSLPHRKFQVRCSYILASAASCLCCVSNGSPTGIYLWNPVSPVIRGLGCFCCSKNSVHE